MPNLATFAGKYKLTTEQSTELFNDLKELEKSFDPQEIQNFYPAFEALMTQYRIGEDDIEAFVSDLYSDQKFSNLVTYIIPSFYNLGGDRSFFEHTYDQMMSNLSNEINE